MSKRIYLVEDERSLSQLLETYLSEEGYAVTLFSDGLTAKAHINDVPDLWVLDIMLPGLDGYALIKAIKEVTPNVPVIFTSARNAELDRVIGLEMGSDDYLPKPFLPRELVLRVNRLLALYAPKTPAEISTIKIADYIFDPNKRAILKNDQIIPLTTKEYDLLAYFIANQDTAQSRDALINAVWGEDYFGSDRVVDDTVRRLRKKLPALTIEPIYGFGYLFKLS